MSAARGGGLTTHVLDTSRGQPAAGLRIDFSSIGPDGGTRLIKTVTTNVDGRCEAPLLGPTDMKIGRYELAFHVARYFRAAGSVLADPPFYDVISVRFAIAEPDTHYHVPLLVSPYGYVTYRGS